MNEKISVIVPVYNSEDYISMCLESLINQSYDNIEIIIVNDGSTDMSSEIIDRYKANNPNIKSINTPNRGVSAARRLGCKNATGDWLGFLDSDDYADSEMYERLVYNGQKYHSDISHCGYQINFEDGRTKYFYNSGLIKIFNRNEGLLELISGNIFEPSICNKIYRKGLIEKSICKLERNLDIKYNEDLLFNYYLFSEADRSVYEDWCPYHYRNNQHSATHSNYNSSKILDPIRVKELILEDSPDSLKNQIICSYLSTCLNSYNNELRHDRKSTNLKEIRSKLLLYKEYIGKLNLKRKLCLSMLIKIPNIYYYTYIMILCRISSNKYR